jgi:hypothetical protein
MSQPVINLRIELPILTEKTLDVQDWFSRYEKTAEMSGWVKVEVIPKADYLLEPTWSSGDDIQATPGVGNRGQ